MNDKVKVIVILVALATAGAVLYFTVFSGGDGPSGGEPISQEEFEAMQQGGNGANSDAAGTGDGTLDQDMFQKRRPR